jgi:hypothetical protein
LLHSDFHNQHYLLKRALYIAHLAHKLKNWEQVKSVKFSWHESDPLKPVVELVPEGDLSDYATISLIAVGPEDIFRLSQLTPEKANVKSKWFTYSTNKDGMFHVELVAWYVGYPFCIYRCGSSHPALQS